MARRSVALFFVLFVVLGAVATPAAGQKPSVEVGFRIAGGVTSSSNGSSASTIGVGGGMVTAGFYLNEQIALEPGVVFTSVSSGGSSISAATIAVALPIYFQKGFGRAGGLFLAPEVGLSRLSGGGSSVSQNFVGASLGGKFKVADNLFWRLQGSVDRYLENDDFFAATQLGASFGIAAYF